MIGSSRPERRAGAVGHGQTHVVAEATGIGSDEPGPPRAEVGRHHPGPAGGQRRGLASGGGAQVDHELARGGPHGRGDELGGFVLDVAIGPHGRGSRVVHGSQGGLSPARPPVGAEAGGEVGREALDDPVGVAELGGPIGPHHRSGIERRRHPAKHGVYHRAATALHCSHGGVEGSMGRGGEEHQLVGAEPERRPHLGLHPVEQEPVDQVVAGPPHPGGPVDQLGDEVAVGHGQIRPVEQLGHEQVGVGAAPVDADHGLDGQAARGGTDGGGG